MKRGNFVISLDFEMMWGVRDHRTISSYGENVAAVRKIVPRLIEMADEAGVHLTFGVVGMMMLSGKEELMKNLPKARPTYKNVDRTPYGNYIEEMNDEEEQYHFAPDLVDYIKKHPQHEIGTHTYCHYYCLEEGQTVGQFEADIQMAQKVAGGKLRSIIFPRNQTNNEYLEVCYKHGIVCYRGNEINVLNRPSAHDGLVKRAFRLIDNYINLTGYNSYSDELLLKSGEPMNIPASRFLRPYNIRLRFLEGLRLKRIKNAMTHAAKKGETYHIWWHPHNFGENIEENFSVYFKILEHFMYLNKKYGMQSFTMNELYNELRNDNNM